MIHIKNIDKFTCVEIDFGRRFYYFAVRKDSCNIAYLVSVLLQFNFAKYPQLREDMIVQPVGRLACIIDDKLLNDIIDKTLHQTTACVFDFEGDSQTRENSLIICHFDMHNGYVINIAMNNAGKIMMAVPKDESSNFDEHINLCSPVFTPQYKQFRTDLKLFLLSKISKLEFVS